MKKLAGLTLGVSLMFVCGGAGLAQTAADAEAQGPPKVLVIQREFVKPGRTGALHQKTESAFVQAMMSSKWSTHYIGMDSMSGPSRSLFLTGFASLEAWEQDNLATRKNATLAAALDRAAVADGDLLTQYESSVWGYLEEMSVGAGVNLGKMRYFDLMTFKVKPGHRAEFMELTKMYKAAYEKAAPDTHWAMFEKLYGLADGGQYLMVTPLKSLAEVDRARLDDAKVMAAFGADGMKRVEELSGSCLETMQANLFEFNPKMSYPTDAWVAADPAFWAPKALAATKPVKKMEGTNGTR